MMIIVIITMIELEIEMYSIFTSPVNASFEPSAGVRGGVRRQHVILKEREREREKEGRKKGGREGREENR
jgi:hypothetical protein